MVEKTNSIDEWCQNIDGEFITMCDYYYLRGTEKVSYHVVWSIIEILQPFYGLLMEQVNILHSMQIEFESENKVPYMYEFFPFFLTPKSTVLRRKKWA